MGNDRIAPVAAHGDNWTLARLPTGSRSLALASLLMMSLAGCAAVTPQAGRSAEGYCAAKVGPIIAQAIPPVPDGAPEQLAAAGFTPDSVRVAGAIGATSQLQALLAAERRPGNGLPLLVARQDVVNQIMLATLEAQASMALLDCEDERSDQLKQRLERLEASRTHILSIAGVVIGASTAVATGWLSLLPTGATAASVVGIVGGVGEAATAAGQLAVSANGHATTKRNFIAEIVRQPEQSSVFPPIVWAYLTMKPTPDSNSIAQEIVAEWQSSGLLAAGDDAKTLFENGSEVDIDALQQYEEMLDLISVRIALMNRDLRRLLAEVITRQAQPRRVAARPAAG